MFVQFTCSIFHLTATAELAVIDDGVTIISNSIFANLNPELFCEFDFARTPTFGRAIPVQFPLKNLRVNYNGRVIAPAHGWKISTSESH